MTHNNLMFVIGTPASAHMVQTEKEEEHTEVRNLATIYTSVLESDDVICCKRT